MLTNSNNMLVCVNDNNMLANCWRQIELVSILLGYCRLYCWWVWKELQNCGKISMSEESIRLEVWLQKLTFNGVISWISLSIMIIHYTLQDVSVNWLNDLYYVPASEPNLKVKSRLKARLRNYGSPLLHRRRDRHNGSRIHRSLTCKWCKPLFE